MKPTIAITTAFEFPIQEASLSRLRNYNHALRKAGAEPVILPPQTSFNKSVLNGLDGLLLSGGGDIPPYLWDSSMTQQPFDLKDEQRTLFEIPLIRLAAQEHVPILGICLGLQMINVSFGGTLILDLPSHQAGVHCKKTDGGSSYHDINIEPGTRLGGFLPSRLNVNSRHHQVIRVPGKDLIVTATASDGVIEALEKKGPDWIVGVQWHPEDLIEDDVHQLNIFRQFVAACQKSKNSSL